MATIRLANGKNFDAAEGLSILDAARAAGLALEHSCRTGRCGACKARVVAGTSDALITLLPEDGLSESEKEAGGILTCARGVAAESDIGLDIADLGALADYPAGLHPCRIDSLERIASDVLVVKLRLPPAAQFRYLAGQYVNVTGPGGIRRSYSIANAGSASDKRLELHIRDVPGGAMSAYWFGAAKQNDLLRLEGPLGSFYRRPLGGERLVFLATGTGIAPVKAMLGALTACPPADQPARIELLWGGRKPEDLYFEPSLPASLAHIPFRFTPVLSRADAGWRGVRGHVQDNFLAAAPELGQATVYACGSDSMIRAARERLLAAGLDARRFHSDAFVCSR